MSEPTPQNSLDTSTASVARAYDYMLGGKDNFDVDREFAHSIMEKDPGLAISIGLNKDFGRRVVNYMAEAGIAQFLDLGSGIPTSPPSVHDTARHTHPDATVVYVDHDPVVIAHNRALRAIGPGLEVIHDSFLDIDAMFSRPELLENLRLEEPVGVLLLSVLQNSTDEEVESMMRSIQSRLAPGSMIAISHVNDQTSGQVQEQVGRAIAEGQYPYTRFRSREDIAHILRDTALADPGIVDYRDWRPSETEADERPDLGTQFYGALGITQ